MNIKTRKYRIGIFSSNNELPESIQSELLHFLFDQLPTAIIAELIVAAFAGIVLWKITSPIIMIAWLAYLLIFSTGSRAIEAYYYKHHKNALSMHSWTNVYRLLTFFSAVFWGFMGGYLMPNSGLVYQSFVIFILIGITTGSNVMYSANRSIYTMFLLVSLSPLAVRFYMDGGLYFFIGSSAVIYIISMLLASYNIHALLKNAITLRFENTDLGVLNQDLEKSITFQANHDALTKLPNRVLLHDRVEHDLAIANRFQSQLGVMYLNLDHFKDINDLLGFQKGDRILQIIANRIQGCVRKMDTIARFGGDEFIILFITKVQKEMTELCSKILKAIALPIHLGDEEVHVTASIGVSIYPHDGLDSATLFKHANLAMYMAKKAGRNYFQMYSDTINFKAKRKHEIQQQLVMAQGRNEFSLMYQPIVDFKNNQIIGAEALVRWVNPVLGMVSPEEFIAIAEDVGTIMAISEWIIYEAAKQNKQWQLDGAPKIKVAVNISSIQLKRGNLTDIIRNTLNKVELSPEDFMIELTETTLMDNSKTVIHKLHEISMLGVEIAIDDFGSGYSSFRYLTEFPANRLKIDKALIHHCESNPKVNAVLNAIVIMSHQLNMRVVAEGIETDKQLNAVKLSGCDEMQGFIFSKPLEARDFFTLLMKNRKVTEPRE